MWSLWPVPIRLPAAEIEIQADRRLAFQVLTAWGAAGPSGEPSSRVLREDGERKLIEFRTPIKGLFGRIKVYRTVEWVTTHEPDSIEFIASGGPLPLLKDRIVLEERGGCTRMRYESTFGVRGWLAGWLIGKLYVGPTLKRFMRHHLMTMKETIEARAKRSRVFPQQPCPPLEEADDAAQ
ncbi:MAG: hypothetical protein V3V35_05290 [Dehalococcoidia bacterium]